MNTNRQLKTILWIGVALLGGVTVLLSLAGGLIFLLMPSTPPGDTTPVVLTAVSAAIGFAGVGLLLVGIQGARGRPSPPLYTRWAWIAFLVLEPVLVIGGALLPGAWHSHPLFGLVHLGAVLMPALFMLALLTRVAGREHAMSLRQLALTAGGGLSAILIAFPVELLGLVFSAIVVVLVTPLFPGGAAEVERLSTAVERWTITSSTQMDDVFSLLASPVVISVLGITLAIITPLVEEAFKALIVGAMGLWRRPSLTRAFLWGAGCGLAFAVIEGVPNGAASLGEPIGWVGGVTMRALATGMHMLTSGLVGLGWGLLWNRRWWGLPLAYAGAVAIHGLWNLNVVAIVGGVGLGMSQSPFGYLIAGLGVLTQLALILFTPVALFGTPLLLRRAERQEI